MRRHGTLIFFFFPDAQNRTFTQELRGFDETLATAKYTRNVNSILFYQMNTLRNIVNIRLPTQLAHRRGQAETKQKKIYFEITTARAIPSLNFHVCTLPHIFFFFANATNRLKTTTASYLILQHHLNALFFLLFIDKKRGTSTLEKRES